MIIDFHTHCFPDALAPRAVALLQKAGGGLPAYTDGTVRSLCNRLDTDGVDAAVALHIATNPHQQHSVNDFAASIQNERLFCFGSVHPDAPDALQELERIAALGLHGVKLHPEYQHFYVDDERMKPIYRKISLLKLPVVFHSGYDLGFGLPLHCTPQRLARALSWLDTDVVAAHWGAWCDWQNVLDKLCGLPLYFDTSFGKSAISPPIARQIVQKHGAERILFGSDCPWHAPKMDLDFLSYLELDQQQMRAILGENAKRLLHIG